MTAATKVELALNLIISISKKLEIAVMEAIRDKLEVTAKEMGVIRPVFYTDGGVNGPHIGMGHIVKGEMPDVMLTIKSSFVGSNIKEHPAHTMFFYFCPNQSETASNITTELKDALNIICSIVGLKLSDTSYSTLDQSKRLMPSIAYPYPDAGIPVINDKPSLCVATSCTNLKKFIGEAKFDEVIQKSYDESSLDLDDKSKVVREIFGSIVRAR